METLLHKTNYKAKTRPVKVSSKEDVHQSDISSFLDEITPILKVKKNPSLKDEWSNFTDNISAEMLHKIFI